MNKEKLINIINEIIKTLNDVCWYGFTIVKNEDDKLQWFEIKSDHEMSSLIADGSWDNLITIRSGDVIKWNIIRDYNENKLKNEDIDRYLKIVNILDPETDGNIGYDTYTLRDIKYINSEDEFNKFCTEINIDDNQDEEEVYEKMFEDKWDGIGNYDKWEWNDGSCNYYRLEKIVDMLINETEFKSLDDYIKL